MTMYIYYATHCVITAPVTQQQTINVLMIAVSRFPMVLMMVYVIVAFKSVKVFRVTYKRIGVRVWDGKWPSSKPSRSLHCLHCIVSWYILFSWTLHTILLQNINSPGNWYLDINLPNFIFNELTV